MGGIARLVGELLEQLDLREVTLGMSDWGGGLLLVGSEWEERIGRLVICSCEAFENVPPKGAARLLPYIARVPGGMVVAVAPFRFDSLRRLPMTYGPLSRRKVPREVMDRWFGPVTSSREIRRDLGKYVRSAHRGRRELLAACERLESFARPALVVSATEDKLMVRDHGRRLAEILPKGRLVEVEDSYTLIPEDQPELLGRVMRGVLGGGGERDLRVGSEGARVSRADALEATGGEDLEQAGDPAAGTAAQNEEAGEGEREGDGGAAAGEQEGGGDEGEADGAAGEVAAQGGGRGEGLAGGSRSDMAVLACDGVAVVGGLPLLSYLSGGLLGVESGTEVRAGAMEAGLHRGAAEAEGLGGGGAGEALDVAEDEDGALVGGKGGDCVDDALRLERIVDAIAALSPDQRAVLSSATSRASPAPPPPRPSASAAPR